MASRHPFRLSPSPSVAGTAHFLALLPQIITLRQDSRFHDVRGQNPPGKVTGIREMSPTRWFAFRRPGPTEARPIFSYPSMLARYAVAQIKDGRLVGPAA